MTSLTALTTDRERCYGTSQAFYIQWQGKLYGPYANDAQAMVQDGFRFDGGEPLADPFRGKDV